jgi:multiple antibiotic resistance protein
MTEFFWQAFMTLFVVIDPIAAVPVFITLTKSEDATEKQRIAKRACLISIILLLSFGIVGDSLLDAMGISKGAFQIAGGFLLLLAAIDMVIAKEGQHHGPTEEETKEARKRQDVSVFPLAIPLIAGPGSLTSMVVLLQQSESIGWFAYIILFACVLIVIGMTYVGMMYGGRLLMKLGITGINVLIRVCGIILAALAIQNIIHGIKSAFTFLS